MTLPAIKIVEGPTTARDAASDAATLGMSGLLSAGSVAVDLMPHEREDLIIFLTNRLAIAKTAKTRAKGALGRMYNRFSGEDPDYIELSGVHLKQTLQSIERPVPDVVVAAGQYKLRLDIALAALEALEKAA